MIHPERRKGGNSPSTPEKNRNTPNSEKGKKGTADQRRHNNNQEMDNDKRQDPRNRRGKSRGFPDRQFYQSGNYRRFEQNPGGKLQRENRQYYRRQDEEDSQKNRRFEPWRHSNQRNGQYKRNFHNRQTEQSYHNRQHHHQHHQPHHQPHHQHHQLHHQHHQPHHQPHHQHHQHHDLPPDGRGEQNHDYWHQDFNEMHIGAFSELPVLPHEVPEETLFNDVRMRHSTPSSPFGKGGHRGSVEASVEPYSGCTVPVNEEYEKFVTFASPPTNYNVECLDNVEHIHGRNSLSVDFEAMSGSSGDEYGHDAWNYHHACSSFASLETMPSFKRNSVELSKGLHSVEDVNPYPDPMTVPPEAFVHPHQDHHYYPYQAFYPDMLPSLMRCADQLQTAMQQCLQQSINRSAQPAVLQLAATCIDHKWRTLLGATDLLLVHGGPESADFALNAFRESEAWVDNVLGASAYHTPLPLRVAMTSVPEPVLTEAVRRTRLLPEGDYE